MRIQYNLTKKVFINNSDADRYNASVINGILCQYRIDGHCVAFGSCDADGSVLFYLLIGSVNENKEIVADIFGTYAHSKECINEIFTVCTEALVSGDSSDGKLSFSRAALRATLKRIYSNSDAYAYVPVNASRSFIECIEILGRIIRYLDLHTLTKYDFAAGCEVLTSKKKMIIIEEDSRDLYYNSYPCDLEASSNKDTLVDRLADYLLSSDISEKNQLLGLLAKYGAYADENDESTEAAVVYSAFVEGDEEQLIRIVHEYCTDMYRQNKAIDIENGVGAVLRQNLRDRYVLKLIYDGYDHMTFQEMFEKNRPDIAFCNAFRAVDTLFDGDNAESYNVILASGITSDAEDSDIVYDLVKAEAVAVELLMAGSENPMEFAMINAYNRVLISLLKRAEDVIEIEDEPEMNEYEAAEQTEQGTDRSAETDKNVEVTEPAYASDCIELERLKLISEMTADNYRQVYSILFGSDYLNELLDLTEEESQKNAVLLDFYKSKLGALFADYYDFRNELNKDDSINGNEALKLIVKEKYSDMLCYALENCDESGLSDVVAGYEVDLVDDRVFFPMLYSRACDIIIESGSCDAIDSARKNCENEVIDTILLAAKFASSLEILPQYFFIELEELVAGFPLIEQYINGDIVFNASVHGVKYCGISLKMYIDARQGENIEKIRYAAENSVMLNNFLADMNVEGFARIENKTDEAENSNKTKDSEEETIFETVESTSEPSGTERNVESGVLVVIDEKKTSSDKKASEKSETYTARAKQEFDEPETYRVITKNENAEKMKFSIFALSALTVIALIIFILITYFNK